MTDQQPNERDQQGRHGPGTAGAWQPVPGGGDYDPDQTMHVSFAAQLPPEPRPGEDPLGAHGPAGPGWAGQGEGGYQEDGGYRVSGPLFAPGPDDGAAYDYRPQEQPGPHGGHSGHLPGGPERPYEHGGHGGHGGAAGGGPGGPGPDGTSRGTEGQGAGGSGDHDPATAWSIPVIREESEAESGEYSLGAFSPSWDQTPSPAPTQSFPAGMFGQGAAAAAQAAQERAAAARARGDAEAPSDPGSGHWEMPFTGPEGGDAVPWLPAHAPAADAAWSGIVDDPEGPPAATPATGGTGTGRDRPAGHDGTAAEQLPYSVPSFDDPAPVPADEPAVYGEGEPAAYAAYAADDPAEPAGPDDAVESASAPGADGPDEAEAAGGASPHDGTPDFGAGPGEDGADGAPGGDPASDGGGDGASDTVSGSDTGAAPDAVQDAGSAPDFGPDGTGPAEPGSAEPGSAEAFEPAEPTRSEHPLASYMLRVNGTDRPVTDAWLGESLLYVLRERLGLAGAKDGCEQGECGACSVQVDGRLVASCLVPAATAAGSEVRTVEGLTVDGRPSDVQCALADSGAVQCGFCIPGMAMTVHDLLEGNHKPTDLDVRQALSGNLCRCSGYRGVLDAVRSVVASRDAGRDPDDPAAAGPDDPARVPHQGGPAGSGGVQ